MFRLLFFKRKPDNAPFTGLTACLVFCLLSIGAPAGLAESDHIVRDRKIHWVSSPTLGVPAIVQAGRSFELALSDSSAAIAAIRLIPSFPADGNGSAPSLPSDRPSVREEAFRVRVPPGVAHGLYDLEVELKTSTGETFLEIQPHAVKIVDEFKKDFRFAIVSDIHFGDNRGRPFAPGRDLDALRRNALKTASGFDPEFILLTGDVTDLPNDYPEDYLQAWLYFKEWCRAPLFMVPGNHDGYIAGKKDGKRFWSAFFGRSRYFFDYGEMRFVGLDNYDWPSKFRNLAKIRLMSETESINRGNMSPGQFQWLEKALQDPPGKTVAVFAHLPLDEMKGGVPYEGEPLPGAPAREVIDLLNSRGVEHVFVGHWHRNKTQSLGGGLTQIMTTTAGSDPYSDEMWGINVVTVKDWKIAGVEFVKTGFD